MLAPRGMRSHVSAHSKHTPLHTASTPQVTGVNATAAFADLTSIYHADQAFPALKPPVPSNVSCAPPAPGTCSMDASRGDLVPWVREINVSTVYGTGVNGGADTPLLGLFDTEDGCQKACTLNANCTKYTWQAGEVCQMENGHWTCDQAFAKHCYGRYGAQFT